MGGSLAKCGDAFTCMRKHGNSEAVFNTVSSLVSLSVQSEPGSHFSHAADLNNAVFLATNKGDDDARIFMQVELFLACENLPNYDTFTRTDAMAILYVESG